MSTRSQRSLLALASIFLVFPLASCNPKLDWVSVEDSIITVTPREGNCIGLGKQRIYVLHGEYYLDMKRRKPFPPGICMDINSGNLHRFKLMEFRDKFVKEFPILTNTVFD
jgi:hypothetical protein